MPFAFPCGRVHGRVVGLAFFLFSFSENQSSLVVLLQREISAEISPDWFETGIKAFFSFPLGVGGIKWCQNRGGLRPAAIARDPQVS